MKEIITQIIQAVWLFLPAAFANMAPVFAKFLKIKFFDYPVDFGRKFYDKKRILGEHKTFRGFFFGVLSAMMVIYIQKLLLPFINADYLLIDYSSVNLLLLGFLFGFGALFGDSLKSFFKRRVGIAPGKPWRVFDEADWIIGAVVFAGIAINFPLSIALTAILVYGLLHPVADYFGKKLGLR